MSATMNYVAVKEKEIKKPQFLMAEGVRHDSIPHMLEDFKRVNNLKPRLTKNTWHVAISFPTGEEVDNETMIDAAKEYVKKFGIEQYVVVRHNDTEHAHIHILANRIKFDGTAISDKFCAQRGVEFAKKYEKILAEKYQTKTKQLSKTHKEKLPEHTKVKYEIYAAILKVIPKSDSWQIACVMLQENHGIDVITHENAGGVYGLSYKKGEYKFKASEIDKRLGFSNFVKNIEIQRQKRLKEIEKQISEKKQQAPEKKEESKPKQDNGLKAPTWQPQKEEKKEEPKPKQDNGLKAPTWQPQKEGKKGGFKM